MSDLQVHSPKPLRPVGLASPFPGPCPLLSFLAVLVLAAEAHPLTPAQSVLCPLMLQFGFDCGVCPSPMPTEILEVELPTALLTVLVVLQPSLQVSFRRSVFQQHPGSSSSALIAPWPGQHIQPIHASL